MKSYVYENTEVRLTGRTGQRKLTSGKIDEVVEITPVDQMVGSWKKWVQKNSLYEVVGDDE